MRPQALRSLLGMLLSTELVLLGVFAQLPSTQTPAATSTSTAEAPWIWRSESSDVAALERECAGSAQRERCYRAMGLQLTRLHMNDSESALEKCAQLLAEGSGRDHDRDACMMGTVSAPDVTYRAYQSMCSKIGRAAREACGERLGRLIAQQIPDPEKAIHQCSHVEPGYEAACLRGLRSAP